MQDHLHVQLAEMFVRTGTSLWLTHDHHGHPQAMTSSRDRERSHSPSKSISSPLHHTCVTMELHYFQSSPSQILPSLRLTRPNKQLCSDLLHKSRDSSCPLL
ncbi:Uncharacterized protein Fot_56862 [Forsythia ovata]|uniref:Uncharacterized protein n=1 Tax=Forsythia ovata TaxID=205694 RepID=A0ABD1P0W7_9LAMI